MAKSACRLFVAAWPPPAGVAAMLDAVGGLSRPEGRMVPADNVHLTLHFIGPAPARELPAIAETVEHATHGVPAFELHPVRLITLPERGPARLIALETDAPPAVVELHRRLVSRLARTPRTGGRPFRPHLTLCRFRPPAAGFRLDVACPLEPFAVTRVDVMQSELRPDGARYHVVASSDLVPAG